jgi:hypothetical protein
MKARSVLTLLVVLALSSALFMTTAGSAVHREVTSTGPQPSGVVVLKDGDGNSDGGDDDRWGSTSTTGTPPVPAGGSNGTTDGQGQSASGTSSARVAPSVIRVEVGVFFRIVLIYLCMH